MKILSLIFVLSLCLQANATVTISNVTNASNTVDLTESSPKIMAGVSGNRWCAAANTAVLDTCTLGAGTGSCNYRTVCENTLLQITLKSDKSGDILLVDSDNNSIALTNGSDYTANESRVVSIEWGDLCNAIGAGNSCLTTGITETLKIGVNETGDNALEDTLSVIFEVYEIADNVGFTSFATATEGVEDYYLFPGDEKAIIKAYTVVEENFSVTGAAPIIGLRGFFIPGTCASAANLVNTSNDSVLVTIDDEKSIENPRIESGLSNGTQYLFMFGFQDEAGNIGLFKDLVANCDDLTTPLFTYDRHSVMPLPVNGLLEENQNCYITTAAYGSPLHGKVKTFKLFRDQILNKFVWGKKLINFYYKTSPPIAETIRKNDFLRSATRVLLWPAWAISAAVLYMGLMPFLFVITMTLLSFVFLRNKNVKKKLIIAFLILSVNSAKAEDDFFSTSESATPTPKESAPKEPPYTGNEDEEFTEMEDNSLKSKAEETYVPEIEAPAENISSGISESPDKWKPYRRIPEKGRLQELSKDGLMKITKKGGYNYKVKPSDQKHAASFRFGVAAFPHLENGSGVDFSEVYDTDKKPILLVDYEWQFFKSFGKLGIKVGSGLMVATGSGQFSQLVPTPENPSPGGTTDAEEKYNFYMFPNSLSAIYRLDIFERQWIVPFGEIGIDYISFIEARDDGQDIKFGGSPHFHFAVGGSFLLDTLGKDMMTEIDKQYGVNHMWLTAEFRHLESMGTTFDFTDDVINGGIMVEF